MAYKHGYPRKFFHAPCLEIMKALEFFSSESIVKGVILPQSLLIVETWLEDI
jgi:hypothetical protein